VTQLYLLAALANLWVLLAILAAAFLAQFSAGEPPCPLCVMQRIAMMLAALGPCHILLAGSRSTLTARDIAIGSGMTGLASLLGAAISIRQVLLHILPGDPGFGMPVMGYHLYTWAAITFACMVGTSGLQLVGLAWFEPQAHRVSVLTRTSCIAVALMVVANVLSVVAEAGVAWKLPDNPTTYLLFWRTIP
jgi:disulfide bond formation protein DsbB